MTTRQVKLVGKKEFVFAALNSDHETYIVYIASLNFTLLIAFDVHLFQKHQISGFIAEEVFTKVFAKYSDFAEVFSLDLMSKLPKYTRINDHTIKLVND